MRPTTYTVFGRELTLREIRDKYCPTDSLYTIKSRFKRHYGVADMGKILGTPKNKHVR